MADSPKRILWVEDEIGRDNVEETVLALRFLARGFPLEHAKTAKEALDKLENNIYAGAIVDLMLPAGDETLKKEIVETMKIHPSMGGVLALDRIKNGQYKKADDGSAQNFQMPVVVLSGVIFKEVQEKVQELLEGHPYKHLLKPFLPEKIVNTLLSIMKGD